MSEDAHQRILFFAKSASIYIRGLAEQIFGVDLLITSVYKDLDPRKRLVIQSKLVCHPNVFNFVFYSFLTQSHNFVHFYCSVPSRILHQSE